MIRVVASQHLLLGPKVRQRRPGTIELPRGVHARSGRVVPGGPRNTPLPQPTKPSRGRLRLVGEGDVPARKIWRLKMIESTEMAFRFPGLNGALRLWSAARAPLALFGLAVVLVAVLPAPREALLRQLATWSEDWEEQDASAPVSAGTIQPGADSPTAREQRAVTEFIAKRYRIAQDATAGFVATAYRVGGEWKVDPLLLLAVMAVESRYNPVAESNMGAKGLMQVMAKFHAEKLVEHGGEGALLDPDVNIKVGAQILREYLRRFGETETALQMYAGAFDEPSSSYAVKVLAERARLEQLLKQVRRSVAA